MSQYRALARKMGASASACYSDTVLTPMPDRRRVGWRLPSARRRGPGLVLKGWVWGWARVLTSALWLFSVVYAIWALSAHGTDQPRQAMCSSRWRRSWLSPWRYHAKCSWSRAGEPTRAARVAEAARYEELIAATGEILQHADQEALVNAAVVAMRGITGATHIALFAHDPSTGVLSVLDADPDLTPEEVACCVPIAARVADSGQDIFAAGAADPEVAGFRAHLRVTGLYACPMTGSAGANHAEQPPILVLLSSGDGPPLALEQVLPSGCSPSSWVRSVSGPRRHGTRQMRQRTGWRRSPKPGSSLLPSSNRPFPRRRPRARGCGVD